MIEYRTRPEAETTDAVIIIDEIEDLRRQIEDLREWVGELAGDVLDRTR